jgi:hypothetical protein
MIPARKPPMLRRPLWWALGRLRMRQACVTTAHPDVVASTDDDETDSWSHAPISEAVASRYVGKYILVGITREGAAGNTTDRYQIHGVIESLAPNGMVISLRGSCSGEEYSMPPAMDGATG